MMAIILEGPSDRTILEREVGVAEQRGEPRDGAVQQVVRSEHRRLGEQFVELARVFDETGAQDELRDAFAALYEELDVHFEQEDRLYYSSIRALRPDLAPEIREISAAHHRFRLQLGAIGDQLGRGDVRAAREGFATLAADYRQHEAREEALLQRIDPTLAPTP